MENDELKTRYVLIKYWSKGVIKGYDLTSFFTEWAFWLTYSSQITTQIQSWSTSHTKRKGQTEGQFHRLMKRTKKIWCQGANKI